MVPGSAGTYGSITRDSVSDDGGDDESKPSI